MTILLSDPRVHAVPVLDNGEPLVALLPSLSPTRSLVRSGLADRLYAAALALPADLSLLVVEGHRTAQDQSAIITRYAAELRRLHPHLTPSELDRLSSRFVSPLAVAPHLAGGAVDLTLVDDTGRQFDLGTAIDATPEQSNGRCYFAAETISAEARHHRTLLARALGDAGLENYPTEWWHWSYGGRYWALATGAMNARARATAAALRAGLARRSQGGKSTARKG